MRTLICLLLGLCITGSCAASGYEIANGYFYLHGHDGWFDTLKFDPAGKGKYGGNLIISMSVGEKPDSMPDLKATQSEGTLTLSGYQARMPFQVSHSRMNVPFELTAGHTVGVLFHTDGKITSAGGSFPTWHGTTSGCTISLYRVPDGDMAKKELVSSQKVTNVPDNSDQTIEFTPQPPGTYYAEISEPVGGQIGWWGIREDDGSATSVYLDGKEEPALDLSLVYGGFTEIPGEWSITLDGANLQSTFMSTDPNADLKDCSVFLMTPWEKQGYDVSKFPFSRFYTDSGQHILVQELKRRPGSDHLRGCKWAYAMGKKNADLRLNFAPGQHLGWAFRDHDMTWKLNGTSLNLDVLPHNPKLPSYYPQFYSSDQKYADILNEFYYSHALNFGVGTPPDWKEWQALILDWTANPQMKEQRGHFTGVKMRDDGYVYTWSGQEGWPFPFKDEDKDGKNDYDTRHFTTNPCFILGAYRYFCWTRDVDFLKEVMPKLRKAMAYDLDQLQGRSGIIVIDAKGHEGRADCIGSNYWDILPFGFKDAFCNSYYYEALKAMADLERYCQDTGLECAGPKESPQFYDALRLKVRKAYNRTFWNGDDGRYAGCVDIDGVKHDYGFTFVNLEAMAYGLADKWQVQAIYDWMERGTTSSGQPDTYTKYIFAPRANTIHSPGKSEARSQEPEERPGDKGTKGQGESVSPSAMFFLSSPQSEIRNPRSEIPSGVAQSPTPPVSPWWFFGWGGTPYGDQCQDGGAILYTSGYDIIARAKYVSADNAWKRLTEILDRYNMPDRLCGGSPLYRGEQTQGGPGGSAGSVGVEGEFPESGLAPASFLYAFLGIDADARRLTIRPNLPSTLKYAGVRNLCYAGQLYDIKVTNTTVEVTPLGVINPVTIRKTLAPGESFILQAGRAVAK